MSTDTKNTQQCAYSDFHLQYIAGSWQQGKDDSVNTCLLYTSPSPRD